MFLVNLVCEVDAYGLLDGRSDNLLREVFGPYITTDSDGVATSCPDLPNNSIGFLLIET